MSFFPIKPLPIFFLILLPWVAFSNAAQPGFWNAGGTGNFSLLYPEDSAGYHKIQMVKELVSIQLYRGYAVVKGQYWMYNETNEEVNIKVGYPLNSIYDGNSYASYRAEIQFDSLYSLRAFSNGKAVEITQTSSDESSYGRQHDNWYTWNNHFPPQNTTEITVYFIVNTNNNYVRGGYNKESNNGFIYLLESGATWKQPIVKGEIRMQIKDNFGLEDIKGVYPDSLFLVNENTRTLLARFQNLSPTPKDNIIVAYTRKVVDFDFKAVLANEFNLYDAIDQFSSLPLNEQQFSPMKFGNPFEVAGSTGDKGISFLFLLTIYGPVILIILSLLFIVLMILRWWKNQKNRPPKTKSKWKIN